MAWFDVAPSVEDETLSRQFRTFVDKQPFLAGPISNWISFVPPVDQRWRFLMTSGVDGFGMAVVLFYLLQNCRRDASDAVRQSVRSSLVLLRYGMDAMAKHSDFPILLTTIPPSSGSQYEVLIGLKKETAGDKTRYFVQAGGSQLPARSAKTTLANLRRFEVKEKPVSYKEEVGELHWRWARTFEERSFLYSLRRFLDIHSMVRRLLPSPSISVLTCTAGAEKRINIEISPIRIDNVHKQRTQFRSLPSL